MARKVRLSKEVRVCQGDIFRNVEMIEYAVEVSGIFEISKIVFPLVIVLTQDCDLEQEYKVRWSRGPNNKHDKWLFSVLVAPLYNLDHVFKGEHLSSLDMEMRVIDSSTTKKHIRNNEIPRYHFITVLETDSNLIPDSVIDFKHYFSVNGKYLRSLRKEHFVCRLAPLFKEDVSQRFSHYLARIGLPE